MGEGWRSDQDKGGDREQDGDAVEMGRGQES